MPCDVQSGLLILGADPESEHAIDELEHYESHGEVPGEGGHYDDELDADTGRTGNVEKGSSQGAPIEENDRESDNYNRDCANGDRTSRRDVSARSCNSDGGGPCTIGADPHVRLLLEDPGGDHGESGLHKKDQESGN